MVYWIKNKSFMYLLILILILILCKAFTTPGKTAGRRLKTYGPVSAVSLTATAYGPSGVPRRNNNLCVTGWASSAFRMASKIDMCTHAPSIHDTMNLIDLVRISNLRPSEQCRKVDRD